MPFYGFDQFHEPIKSLKIKDGAGGIFTHSRGASEMEKVDYACPHHLFKKCRAGLDKNGRSVLRAQLGNLFRPIDYLTITLRVDQEWNLGLLVGLGGPRFGTDDDAARVLAKRKESGSIFGRAEGA